MNNEVKKLWIDALRSGEYKQTTGTLADTTGHCCLGVLCELAIKNGVPITKEESRSPKDSVDYYIFVFDGDTMSLPPAVKDWANLTCNPVIFGRSKSLAEINDDGVDFHAIADLIEQELL